jgi:hypothetical protein
MSFGDGGVGKEASRARQEEQQRKVNIEAGSTKVRNDFAHIYDKKYYDDLLQKVKDHYIGAKDATGVFRAGEVTEQFENARKQMQSALMNAGLFDSYVAVKREKDAEKARLRAENEVTQRGVALQNQRQQDVEYAKNQVLNQLSNTGDASSAFANSAAAIKANYNAPAMPMLGQVVTDLSAGLATQAQMERQGNNAYTLFGRIPGWGNSSRYSRNVG